jgi:hypothetical protein
VVELETGRDVSSVVFDRNSFDDKTNPLFVEVSRAKLVPNKGKGTMPMALFPDDQSTLERKRRHQEGEADQLEVHMLIGNRPKRARAAEPLATTTCSLPSTSAIPDDTKMDES